MSEPHVIFGCFALSSAVLMLLTAAEALGVSGIPFGGSAIAQIAIVYLVPLGISGVVFAIVYIARAIGLYPDNK